MKVIPPDTVSRDECVVLCRQRLSDLLRRRDFSGVADLVSPQISLSRDDSVGGIANFLLEYKSNQEELWKILEFCLSFDEARLDKNKYVLPYVLGLITPDNAYLGTLVATKDHVPVYASPDSDASVIDILTYDVVRSTGVIIPSDGRLPNSQSEEIHKVELPSGATGYVRRNEFISPLDPYITLECSGDDCVLTAVIPSTIGPTFEHYQ